MIMIRSSLRYDAVITVDEFVKEKVLMSPMFGRYVSPIANWTLEKCKTYSTNCKSVARPNYDEWDMK